MREKTGVTWKSQTLRLTLEFGPVFWLRGFRVLLCGCICLLLCETRVLLAWICIVEWSSICCQTEWWGLNKCRTSEISRAIHPLLIWMPMICFKQIHWLEKRASEGKSRHGPSYWPNFWSFFQLHPMFMFSGFTKIYECRFHSSKNVWQRFNCLDDSTTNK